MGNSIRELVVTVKVEADTTGFTELDQAQEKSQAGSVALGTAIGNLTADLIKAGIEAGKAAAAFAVDLVLGTAEAGDEIAKTSAKLRVASDQLQRLRGAAQLSGAEIKSLDTGVKTLQKNLGAAIEKGTGPAVEALATLGLEVADVDSLLADGDLEGALGLIGDAANGLGDDVRSNAALLKLFGGAGGDLGPLLRAGTDGIKGMGDAISETGSVIGDEALKQFEALADSNLLLEKQFEGVKNQIAIGLAPVVTDIGGRISDWVSENEEFIQQDLPVIMADVADALIEVGAFTIDLLKSWREFIRDGSDLVEILVETDDGLGSVATGFATVGAIVDGVALGIADMTVELLEALGASQELINVFKEIQLAITGDDGEARVARGAGAQRQQGQALEGGGQRTSSVQNSSVDPRFSSAAESTGDTSKLRKIQSDPGFTDGARATAGAQATAIEDRTAAAAQAEADKAATERSASIGRSRSRARGARRTQQRAKGGGGGGATAAAEAPSADDLIAGAIGAATGGGPARVGGSALAGTLLVNVDQSTNITMGASTITIELPAEALGSGSPQDIGSAVRVEIESWDRSRRTTAFDQVAARSNVGGG